VVQVDAEARLERAGQHVLPLLVEHLGAGQAAAEHLHRGLGVDAVRLEEDERLGERLDVRGHDELVGGLHRLAGAVRADVHDGPADHVEDRLGGLEVVRLAADHDRQGRVDRPLLAAGDRRVDDAEAALPRLGSEVGGHIRSDAGEVDDQAARPCGLEDTALAGEYVGHVRRVRHHHRDDLGVPHCVRDRRGRTATRLDERLALVRAVVEASDLVAGVREVDRHRAAHDAEADEGDVRHA
jgi:hypothetical protein